MQPVPRIFVSATSRDLRTARTLVSEGLRRMECLPIVQDDFPPDYKSVRDMLLTKIKTCDAVLHLAGFYYGAEPNPVPPDPERRSFTQMEYEIAMELGLPCYVFLCGDKFPFDEHDPEPEEKRALQLAHRERLLSRDELFYEFDSREDLNSRTRELQLSVDALRDELASERKRRRMTLIVSAAALLVALIGGIFLYSKTQSQKAEIDATAEKLDQQGELIAMLLAEQQRLRDRNGSGDIAAIAEETVAREAKISPEEVRLAVQSAISSAEAAVAGTSGVERAAALKNLGDAQLAAGLETEAVASYRERLGLLDRDTQPAEWVEATAELADLIFPRDYTSTEAPEMVAGAAEWAKADERLGPDHPATLRVRRSLRNMTFIKGDNQGAIEMGKELLEANERVFGKNSPQCLEAAAMLGRYHRTEGDYDEADVLFERVIETSGELYGENDYRTLTARWDYALSLERRKQYDEAEAIYVDIIERSTAELGEGHANTLSLVASLAFLNESRGDEDKATEIWKELLASARKHHDEDSKEVQSYLHIVAVRSLEQGELDEAEALYQSLFDSRLRTIGLNQKETLGALEGLQLVYDKKEDDEKYLETAKKVIEVMTAIQGPDSADVANKNYSVATSLATAGDAQQALGYIDKALEIRKRTLGEGAEETLRTHVMVQIIANRTEDWELAETKGTQALQAFDEADNYSNKDYASVLYRLALAKEELGKDEAALELVRRAAKIAAEDVEADHWLHPRTAEMLERLQ